MIEGDDLKASDCPLRRCADVDHAGVIGPEPTDGLEEGPLETPDSSDRAKDSCDHAALFDGPGPGKNPPAGLVFDLDHVWGAEAVDIDPEYFALPGEQTSIQRHLGCSLRGT